MTKELPLTATTLANRLHGLDDEAFAEFVADLWGEMGWETTVEGATVTATREGAQPETRRLRALSDDRSRLARLLGRPSDAPDLTDVDVLVVGHRDGDALGESLADPGVTVLDADDLHHRLLYGVDRRTCRALCRQHLGRAVDPIPTGQRSGGRYRVRLGQLVESARENRHQVAGAAVVLAIVIAFATIGVIGSSDSPLIAPGGGTSLSDSAEPVTPVGGPGSRTGTDTPTRTITPVDAPARQDTSTRATPSTGPGPVDADRLLSTPDEGFPESIRFNTSDAAILTFLQLVDESEGKRSLELNLAWRIIGPGVRPPYDVFVEEVHNGTLRPLWAYERLEFDEAGAFDFRGGNATDRLEVTAMADTRRWSYLIEARCLSNRTGNCWQVSGVFYLSSSGSPSFDGGESGPTANTTTATPTRTPTPTYAPANGTRTLPYDRSFRAVRIPSG